MRNDRSSKMGFAGERRLIARRQLKASLATLAIIAACAATAITAPRPVAIGQVVAQPVPKMFATTARMMPRTSLLAGL